ncbi:restriction endonuclease subunit S [Neobacillus sp. OS1-33]|uniref:restriction endonuclease subunit S n=1 Tax=Neobacillus sp. OS1-33 TaxID=3070683 RepID=UPI0027DED201|nr:restriction endonuclease subunit S [Neobacillus sp. OS1-33]WML26280.1 restriction endonuclease subunit S [Neobacillus sp. OS1-33]
MFEFSHSYFRFPEEFEKRLDVLYNDKIYNSIQEKINNSPFEFIPISEAANFIKDSRNPINTPDEEFFYAEIGKVDIVKGKLNPIKMIGKDATSSRVRRIMYKDTIIVSTTRPTRKAISLVPAKYDKEICSTGFAVLKPKPGILPEFLFFALRTDISKYQFEKYCSGAGYPAINQEVDLPQILVPNLDLLLQKQIISNVRKIQYIALKFEVFAKRALEEARAYFREQIEVEFDPDDENNYFHRSGTTKKTLSFYSFPDDLENRLNYLYYNPKLSIVDKLATKYSTTTINEIISEPIKRGNQPKYSDDGENKVIKTVDVIDEGIDLEQCLSVDNEFFEDSSEYHVRKGDILLASTGIGSMGKVALYESDTPAMCDGHVSIIRVKEDYDPSFIAHFLRSHFGQVQIEGLFTGSSGQIELQPVDIRKIVIPDNTDLGVPYLKQVEIANNMDKILEKFYTNRNNAKDKWIEADKTFQEYTLGEKSLT